MKFHFKNKRCIRSNNAGFTLIETIVVIAITVLVGGALTSMVQYFYRDNDYVLQESEAVQNARQGLSTAIAYVREASYGDDGSYPIASVGTSTITFYADVHNNGSVEKVRYYLSEGTLYEGLTYATGTPPSYDGQPESTSTIASYIQNSNSTPLFQYYDRNGMVLSSPVNIANIALITTDLQIDVDPTRTPGTYSLIGSATLRNLENQ